MSWRRLDNSETAGMQTIKEENIALLLDYCQYYCITWLSVPLYDLITDSTTVLLDYSQYYCITW